MLPTITVANINIELYNFFNVFSWFVMYAFNLFQWEKKQRLLFIGSKLICKLVDVKTQHNEKIMKICVVLLIIAETGGLTALQYFPGIAINGALGDAFVNGISTYYGTLFFAPLIFMIGCALIGIPSLKQLDIFMPGYPVALIFMKLSCYCAGCCYGFEFEHGIYNTLTHKIEFPVQLLECGIALILFLILFFYEKKKHPEGTVYPLYVFLYCLTSFGVSFLRKDVSPILGILNVYHIFCLIGIVLAIAEFFIFAKLLPKIKWLQNGVDYVKIFNKFKKTPTDTPQNS